MKQLATILFIVITSLSYAGGPWLVSKKSGFMQIQTTFPTGAYDRIFLENNQDLELQREVWDVNLQGYLEYGLSDKFNIIAVVPLKYVATGALNDKAVFDPMLAIPEDDLFSFGNLQLKFKYRLSNKKIKAAVSLASSLKNVSATLPSGLATGYLASSIGVVGHAGTSWGDWYTYIEAGVHAADNDFSEFIEGNYEIGYQVKKNWWVVGTLGLRSSFKNGAYNNFYLRQTALYTNDQEFFSFGGKTSYEWENGWGINYAIHGAFSGNYVAHIPTMSLGVFVKT